MAMPSTANFNLTALCKEGWLKEALHILLSTHNPPANSSIYLQLLQRCISKDAITEGKLIHSLITHRVFAFAPCTYFQNNLINMYVKCGSWIYARKVFDEMTEREVSSWNVIIAAYRRNANPQEALSLFYQMQRTGVQPDQFTFATIIPVCAKTRALEQGMGIHESIVERGFSSDVVVTSALVDMYVKCGSIHKAHQLFDKMTERDVVSWNAMIAGYAQNRFYEKALETYKKMQLAGVKSVSSTFASILPACAKIGDLQQGIDIHKSIIESGFSSDVVVANALVDMYAKCGRYAQNGLVEKALKTFNQMQLAGIKPMSTTFASIIPVCGKIGALEQGMYIHQSIIKSGFLSDIVVASALVDMYAKGKNIHKARDLFNKMPQKNVVSWTAMVAAYAQNGYAQNGFCKDALRVFELMKHSGTNPDHVSFASVLLACSYVGLVDEGCKYFSDMNNSYCIIPIIDHFVCMIDLLGRAGYLEETLNFIIKMPIQPVVVVWTCLLGACRPHKNIRLGVFTATILFELDPNNAATYVLLSNIYADMGRWAEVQRVRRLMNDRGIQKTPGCSWIEGHKKVHAFFVGDRSHPQAHDIYAKLEELSWEMKAAGYLPDSTHALNDVEVEEKDLFLCHHSEKLAIAFGLLNTPPGTTIRVVKNLRSGKCIYALHCRSSPSVSTNRMNTIKKNTRVAANYSKQSSQKTFQ
ncbi:pentatricopeptide repeat-containing protein At1g11290, chloroplastic [Cryptomeria japonica]|uniref:pentatricopeptide repeat-containing protein At1g11290, chloroplastic n=1 Tax=Cryptomeria japonica TaxID=3369 RepID=UPI0027D9FCBC|nr:pentatricopeptide repeat-containing protein At1g11290, chloroplastic [Cryptomeria japonica]